MERLPTFLLLCCLVNRDPVLMVDLNKQWVFNIQQLLSKRHQYNTISEMKSQTEYYRRHTFHIVGVSLLNRLSAKATQNIPTL
jgi:hypothetical protein